MRVGAYWGLSTAVTVLLSAGVHVPELGRGPAWLFSGLAVGVRPGLIDGRPYLDPNIGYTTEALGWLSAHDWLAGVVPWWNPFSGIGMPLAGEMQPGAFFLPFNLLLLLPGGVLWLTIAMQVLAGLSTQLLLRELRLGRLAALSGGVLFALNGTMAWVPGPAASFCAMAFLPLLLWGIERSRSRGGGAWVLAVAVGIAWSLFAGFPETAYLDGLLALGWTVLRVVQGPPEVARVLALRVGAGGLLGLMLAAPLLIAFYDDLMASDVLVQHATGEAALPWMALPMSVLPWLYGGPNSGSAAVQAVWAQIGGYTTVGVLGLALLGLWRRRPGAGLRWFLAAWVVVCLGRTFGVAPFVALVNLVPGLDRVVVHRFAPASWEFALIVVAAFGLDAVRARWVAGLAVAEAAALVMLPQMSAPRGGTLDLAPIRYLQSHAGLSRTLSLGPLAPNYGARFGVALLNHNVSPAPRDWVRHVDARLAPGYARLDDGITFYPAWAHPFDAEGFGAALLGHLDAYRALGVRFVIAPPGLELGATSRRPDGVASPLALAAGDRVEGEVSAGPDAIGGVAVLVGTYAGASDGDLVAQVCRGGACRSGRRSLREATDNGMFTVPIEGGLVATAGDTVAVTLRHEGGTHPVAIWQWPGAPMHLALVSASAPRAVFHSPAATIWEVSDPAPYASAAGCAVTIHGRERVGTVCASPSVLVRRELFMPGWRAAVNGRDVAIEVEDGVMQRVPLPAGESVVAFRFVPPFVEYGWAGSLVAVLLLAGQAVRLRR